MTGKSPKIILIGTSAGGMQALSRLVSRLPQDLPAAIFVVQHLSVDSSTAFLVNRLSQCTDLNCKVAHHMDPIEEGTLCMAPADQHLLLTEHRMLVVRGPRENQFRPAIDPLFRSAAAYHGANAVGVILTGFLTDGVVGMEYIGRCGGKTVVQDPGDAEFPPLPLHVIRSVEADHIVPISEMGELLVTLAQAPAPEAVTIPTDIWQEARIAERVMMNSTMTKIEDLEAAGERTPYTCPDCGGGLWNMAPNGTLARYRCHSGHFFDKESLVLGMDNNIEETLWVALRSLEERRNVMLHLSQEELGKGNKRWATQQEERAKEMKVHIERIRNLLTKTALTDEEHLGEAS